MMLETLVDLRAENRALTIAARKLEARCEALEAELDIANEASGIDTVPHSFLGMTPTERLIFSLLLSRDFVARDILGAHRRSSAKVLIYNIRHKLSGIGITVETSYGSGYFISRAGRDAALSYIHAVDAGGAEEAAE